MAATNAPATAPHVSTWRHWVPWVLVVLAAIIVLVSALNIWVKRQALDTNNFTNASVRLLENPEVRSALSVYLVDQLYQNVDVSAQLEQNLPAQFKGIAAPLAGALRQLLVRAADTFLQRPRIQALWKEAVMRAHRLFIGVLNGDKEILQTTNGNVVLNLRPIVEQLQQQGGLVGRVAAQLPANVGQITILQGNQLHTARQAVKLVRFLSYFLFFLVLALYALAVYLATGRRRRLPDQCADEQRRHQAGGVGRMGCRDGAAPQCRDQCPRLRRLRDLRGLDRRPVAAGTVGPARAHANGARPPLGHLRLRRTRPAADPHLRPDRRPADLSTPRRVRLGVHRRRGAPTADARRVPRRKRRAPAALGELGPHAPAPVREAMATAPSTTGGER